MALHPVQIDINQDFSGVILASVLYFVVQEMFMMNQVVNKMKGIKGGDPNTFNRFDYASNRLWEMADRSFNNFIEQTPYFITMLWVYAAFCGAELAAHGAQFYIFCRLWFPLFWAMKGKWNMLIELS